jgi:hypothetical protein
MNNKIKLVSHRFFGFRSVANFTVAICHGCARLLLPAGSWLLVAALVTRSAWSQGVMTTVAGTDWVLPAGARPAVEAPLGELRDVAVDRNSALYLADFDNHLVVKISPEGILAVVAGNGIPTRSARM